MTEKEAKIMVESKLHCIELEDLFGTTKGCDKDCDGCKYNYLQGTVGEQKEALRMAIKALETVQKIKYIINEKHYPDAEECDYGQYYRCENALMIADIEDILTELEDSGV